MADRISNDSFLITLKEKSNILNREYQEFQTKLQNAFAELTKSDSSKHSLYTQKIEKLCNDHSYSLNKLEIQSMDAINLNLKPIKNEKRPIYKCKICSKTFKNAAGLGGHSAVAHKSEKRKYECTYDQNCKKSYSRQKRMYHHIRVDHNGNPFKCNECAKSFKYQLELKKHRKTHHRKDDEPNTPKQSISDLEENIKIEEQMELALFNRRL